MCPGNSPNISLLSNSPWGLKKRILPSSSHNQTSLAPASKYNDILPFIAFLLLDGDITSTTIYGDSWYGSYNGGTVYVMGTNWPNGATAPCWTPSVIHQGQGNVGLCDGSVQQLSSSRLRQQLSTTGDTTPTPTSGIGGPNTLAFP